MWIPTNGYVQVKILTKKTTKNGLVLTKDNRKQEVLEIVHPGESKRYKKGQRVLAKSFSDVEHEVDEENLVFVKEDEITAYESRS